MRRLAVLAAILSLLTPGAVGAALAVGSQPPPFPPLKGGWTHITINRKIAGKWHTVILDRGRVIQADGSQMTLLEGDGTTVVIPLDPATIVMPVVLRLTIDNIRRGEGVDAMRIDSGPAVRVRIRSGLARALRSASRLGLTP